MSLSCNLNCLDLSGHGHGHGTCIGMHRDIGRGSFGLVQSGVCLVSSNPINFPKIGIWGAGAQDNSMVPLSCYWHHSWIVFVISLGTSEHFNIIFLLGVTLGVPLWGALHSQFYWGGWYILKQHGQWKPALNISPTEHCIVLRSLLLTSFLAHFNVVANPCMNK